MTEEQIEGMIQAMALSDAEFDKRPWGSLGREDRRRYLERSRQAFNAAIASSSATIRAARLKALGDLAASGGLDETPASPRDPLDPEPPLVT